jgi:DNA-directed RNA polymerase specialized sigma24 family protein
MTSSTKNFNGFVPFRENDHDTAIDFDYGALEESPVFDGDFGECLRFSVNNYLRRKIFVMFRVFDILTEEERRVLIGREVYGKTFRQLGREINRDHKTAKSRYLDALFRIKNSPLVEVESKYLIERNNKQD